MSRASPYKSRLFLLNTGSRSSLQPPLKVWLGSLELDRKLPTPQAIRQILYGSASSTAENADVIALLLTDLEVSEDEVEGLQHLLSRSLNNPKDYIFNEDDKALVIRHLPVQQARLTEHGQRFVLLAVAVHRRNVIDTDQDGNSNHHDCFPVPVYLACKSPRKNEVAANGKAIIVQDIVLHYNGAPLDLVCLSAILLPRTAGMFWQTLTDACPT